MGRCKATENGKRSGVLGVELKSNKDCSAVRTVPSKMFATDETERDPVAVYKFFARKIPQEMNKDDAPFNLAVNNALKTNSFVTKKAGSSRALLA